MKIRLGVVMDPIGTINPKKDTTLALMLAAQRRGFELHYMELGDLNLVDGEAFARTRQLEVFDSTDKWYSFTAEPTTTRLGDLDVILMRKDPPFDTEYIFATYLLERAQHQGCLVVNDPRSLRDANEKLFTAWFPQCCPTTLVARRKSDLNQFLARHKDVVVKPLDGMGGASIFRLVEGDPNISVIIETITEHESRFVMAQKYIPEIIDGDKRILLVDGEPVPYALARIPAKGELRGNLAAGGRGEGRPLTDHDRWICSQVSSELRARGLLFVGLDVIGEYLTEINVTSPTCARELDKQFDLDIGGLLMDAIVRRLDARQAAG
ncbi:MAG: glutathione synthase [Gammaproteobacteria bacterium]|nr:glutathione synthase [Gammaproteobacteria bacterium]